MGTVSNSPFAKGFKKKGGANPELYKEEYNKEIQSVVSPWIPEITRRYLETALDPRTEPKLAQASREYLMNRLGGKPIEQILNAEDNQFKITISRKADKKKESVDVVETPSRDVVASDNKA